VVNTFLLAGRGGSLAAPVARLNMKTLAIVFILGVPWVATAITDLVENLKTESRT
jgi:hypothetical protein